MAKRLERMTDSINKQKGESGFPTRLDPKKRGEMRSGLENLREIWEAVVTQAGKATRPTSRITIFAALSSPRTTTRSAALWHSIVRGFGTKALSTSTDKAKKEEMK